MKIFFKIILLQGFWFLIVHFGETIGALATAIFALVVVYLNYFIYRPVISFKTYSIGIVLITGYGFIQDFAFYSLDILAFKNGQHLLWPMGLWIIFIAYYEDVFNYLKGKHYLTTTFGSIGGALSYFYVYRMGFITSSNPAHMLIAVGISWLFFFPISLEVYHYFQKRANNSARAGK